MMSILRSGIDTLGVVPISMSGTGVADSHNPLDISGLMEWLDANDIATLFQDSAKTTPVTADGDRVGAWADKSPNGNDVLQATAADRGTYKTGIQNGLPIVRFDGVSDDMKATFALNQPRTVYIVVDTTNSVSNDRFYDGLVGNEMSMFRSVTNMQMYAGATWTTAFTIPSNAFHILKSVWNGASSKFAIDGAADDTGNPGAAAITGVTLAAFGAGAPFAQIDIAEFIMYDSVLSSDNQALVLAYLAAKWGISI